MKGQSQQPPRPASGVGNPTTTNAPDPAYANGMAWSTSPYYQGSNPQQAMADPTPPTNPVQTNTGGGPGGYTPLPPAQPPTQGGAAQWLGGTSPVSLSGAKPEASQTYQTQPMQLPSMSPANIGGQMGPFGGFVPSGTSSALPTVPGEPAWQGPQTIPNTVNQVPTGNVPGLVGGNALGAALKDAQDAAYKTATGYLDPQWNQDQTALETKLINQGVTQNSPAWNNAMDAFSRQKEFAYSQARNAAVGQGNASQNMLFNQGLLSNQNQFGQNLAGAQFTNAVQQQLKAQGFTQQQIDNLEAQNRFNNSMTMRNQDINELLLQQQNPLQMLNALTGGGAIQQPQFTATPNANIGGVDIASLMGQQYAGNLNAYNAAIGNQNSMMGGLYGLGSAAMMAPTGTFSGLLGMLGISDRRLKTKVRKIGMHRAGVPLYAFDYVWGSPGVSVMADELETVRPDAVFTLPSGIKAVNYARI